MNKRYIQLSSDFSRSSLYPRTVSRRRKLIHRPCKRQTHCLKVEQNKKKKRGRDAYGATLIILLIIIISVLW